jgi:hypothetical protein
VFISTAGRPKADFRGAILTVDEFFCVWEAAYWAELLYSDVDPKGAIEGCPLALKEAFVLGQKSVTESQRESAVGETG